MPRIRSIKPETWTDEKMLDCSDSCMLFFIALWNFCDDEGKIKNQPRTISKLVARWQPDKVQVFIRSLTASGRLRVSSCSGWLQVTNWSHQKINRVVRPTVLQSEIQWNAEIKTVNSTVMHTDSSVQDIGEDKDIGIGEEGKRVHVRTCELFSISEIGNGRSYMDVGKSIRKIERLQMLAYYENQLENYFLYKNESGEQKCNIHSWFYGKQGCYDINEGHWCREDWGGKLATHTGKPENERDKRNRQTDNVTAALKNGELKWK